MLEILADMAKRNAEAIRELIDAAKKDKEGFKKNQPVLMKPQVWVNKENAENAVNPDRMLFMHTLKNVMGKYV